MNERHPPAAHGARENNASKIALQAHRPDLDIIVSLICDGARVLDIGCGRGDLLLRLREERQVVGWGMELSQQGVNACVAHGLSVIQGNADTDLTDYPDDAFDYVILSQTIQAVRAPRIVLEEMTRIGTQVIISFANLGHWRARWRLLKGQMPTQEPWWETPNIHMCTLEDFQALCRQTHTQIKTCFTITRHRPRRWKNPGRWANLTGEEVVFLLARAHR